MRDIDPKGISVDFLIHAGVYLSLFFALFLFIDAYRYWYLGALVVYWLVVGGIALKYRIHRSPD
ncbi:hypothetical protein [Kordiimonas aestuarii]|uniref:hypothetical protein n=1 Tax=Kordiimonas aestuarii TaxID=1005925 RepID=UPI0021D05766|nr:hypothetical protein [Kordiimonas aestuarii]